ncbi:MAG: SH3 domain-containing protein [Clostridia bacterium]|nr:SH3 domain-containing protein [Clostridia bacterium]
MMKRFLILVASLVLVMSVCMTSALAYETMYVKTGNGKTLNVRSEPATGDNVLLRFPYGHQVTVNYHLGNGWTCIMLAGAYDVGYVQTKFLVSKDPGKYVPSSADAELAKPATSMESYTLEQLNEVLKTARSVTPYTVTLYPTRSSGWVYLRWVPSRNSNYVTTYAGGQQVQVIAELKNWYQVQDADGKVGFVYTSYVQ